MAEGPCTLRGGRDGHARGRGQGRGIGPSSSSPIPAAAEPFVQASSPAASTPTADTPALNSSADCGGSPTDHSLSASSVADTSFTSCKPRRGRGSINKRLNDIDDMAESRCVSAACSAETGSEDMLGNTSQLYMNVGGQKKQRADGLELESSSQAISSRILISNEKLERMLFGAQDEGRAEARREMDRLYGQLEKLEKQVRIIMQHVGRLEHHPQTLHKDSPPANNEQDLGKD